MGILSVRKLFTALASALLLCSCVSKHNPTGRAIPSPMQGDANAVMPPIRIQIFSNDTIPGADKTGGYGYDIFMGDERYIRQQYIPAIPGNIPFSTPGKAYKTAELMAAKLRRHILPPSVSMSELDSLDIIK